MMRHLSSKRARWFVVLGMLLFVGLSSGLAFVWLRPTSPDNMPAIQPKPIGETDYSEPANTPSVTQPVTEQQAPQDLTPTTNDAPIQVTFSHLGGDPVQVRVVIHDLVPDGQCHLTISAPGKPTVQQTAATFVAARSTTCRGFTVPRQSLSVGTWQVSVTVQSGQRRGHVQHQLTIP